MTRLVRFGIVGVAMTFSLPATLRAQSDCPGRWRPAVQDARRFMRTHYDQVWDRFISAHYDSLGPRMQRRVGGPRGDTRERYRRMWRGIWRQGNITILCSGPAEGCGPPIYGYHRERTFSFRHPSINICIRRMAEDGHRFCKLVDTVAHETAHGIGFPLHNRHNDSPSQRIRENDPVYRLGWAAAEVCVADVPANSPLLGYGSG